MPVSAAVTDPGAFAGQWIPVAIGVVTALVSLTKSTVRLLRRRRRNKATN